MRILIINSVCGYGSTGRVCTDIADLLISQGHECRIAYGRGKVPDKYSSIAKRISNSLDVNIHAGFARLTDSTGFHSRKATIEFLKWVDEWKPDLIHLHNIHGYYINIEILFAYLKDKKIPVVWTLHDCWTFTGHCTYFDHAKCNKWKNGCKGNCPQIREYPSSYAISRSGVNYKRKMQAFSDVDNMHIVTPSYWLEELVKQSFLSKYKTHVVHNGIDIKSFSPQKSTFRNKYGLQNKAVYLAVSDGWGKRKGVDDIIQISKSLSQDEKIVMVGFSGKEKESVPDSILKISRTKSVNELAEIYSAADVLLNPTHEDNYPTVNLEAQSCGTPVVTYNTGGSSESVPAENVVPKGDHNGLLNLARQYRTLKVRSAELFDKNKAFERYIELYNEVILNNALL